MARKLAAGNWKMNGTAAALAEIAALADLLPDDAPEVLICPPAPLLYRACAQAQGTPVAIGAQDCHAASHGAYTGDISAQMVTDTGATHVILGHSERRDAYTESDAQIRAKTVAAQQAGLTAIICIGETLAQREAGSTLDILGHQLAKALPDTLPPAHSVIAYEPVWAIGTGRIPTIAQITEAHDFMRETLAARFGVQAAADIPLLYGGSVKPDNAADIFAVANVDGALVGGASLKATDFAPIIAALAQA